MTTFDYEGITVTVSTVTDDDGEWIDEIIAIDSPDDECSEFIAWLWENLNGVEL